MLIKLRELIIGISHKIDDMLARPNAKQKRKLDSQRSLEKDQRLANDAIRSEAKQKIAETQDSLSRQRQQQASNAPPIPQQNATGQNIGVWSGVKLGCGMFIVLPMILLVVLLLFPSMCSTIQKVSAGKKIQNKEDASHKLSVEEQTILSNADTDGNGIVTREEYFAAKEAMQKKENP